jgi:hypothetical protein
LGFGQSSNVRETPSPISIISDYLNVALNWRAIYRQTFKTVPLKNPQAHPLHTHAFFQITLDQ